MPETPVTLMRQCMDTLHKESGMEQNQVQVPPHLGVIKHGIYPARVDDDEVDFDAADLSVRVSKTRTTLTVGDYVWVFEIPSGKWMRGGK